MLNEIGYEPTDVRVIGTFERYEDAQALVDRLAEAGFPVERVTIVGRDLQMIERVTGRMNPWKAALYGAASMIPIALLFGVLFGVLFAPTGVTLLTTVLYWLAVGLVAGAVVSLLSYLVFGRRRRNFASLTGIFASRYEVVADAAVADQALGNLGLAADSGTTTPTPPAVGAQR
jgi:hypothetical protein